MTFSSDITRFQLKYHSRKARVFIKSAELVLESIKDGSSITGAPGQPVDESILKNSWTIRFIEKFNALVSTPVKYARPIEEGMSRGRPMTVRSKTGGFHSVKLTRAGWNKIVKVAKRSVVG